MFHTLQGIDTDHLDRQAMKRTFLVRKRCAPRSWPVLDRPAARQRRHRIEKGFDCAAETDGLRAA